MKEHLQDHQRGIENLAAEYAGALDVQRGAGWQVNHIREPWGTGFSDFYDLGRISLGRGRFTLRQSAPLAHHSHMHSCGINIVVRGRYVVDLREPAAQMHVQSGQVWLRRGRLDSRITLAAQQEFAVLSLDFDPALLERFAHQAHAGNPAQAPAHVAPQTASGVAAGAEDAASALAFFRHPRQPAPALVRRLRHVPERLLGKAVQLLDLPPARDDIDLLALEGAALELLALLLRSSAAPAPCQGTGGNPLAWRTDADQAVDAALHILATECQHKITIAQLSRRVGLNECDLKRAFRQRTGKTIAVWLRERRLALALALLEQGCTLAQAAARSGWGSTRYFAQVFERHFGFAPRQRPQSGRQA